MKLMEWKSMLGSTVVSVPTTSSLEEHNTHSDECGTMAYTLNGDSENLYGDDGSVESTRVETLDCFNYYMSCNAGNGGDNEIDNSFVLCDDVLDNDNEDDKFDSTMMNKIGVSSPVPPATLMACWLLLYLCHPCHCHPLTDRLADFPTAKPLPTTHATTQTNFAVLHNPLADFPTAPQDIHATPHSDYTN